MSKVNHRNIQICEKAKTSKNRLYFSQTYEEKHRMYGYVDYEAHYQNNEIYGSKVRSLGHRVG